MFRVSFISTGTTASQTPVMASISYEIVKNWIKEHQETQFDFPIACIFDFSNMYSTLLFFASDKILMRMGELTSLLEEMRSSTEPDWSKCSFPSKFVHKDTNEPLFFMIPLFPRGMSSFLSKTETLDLTKILMDISLILEKAGSNYIFFDLPMIEVRERNNSVIPALLNSNIIIGVVDCSKAKYEEISREIESLLAFVSDYNSIASPKLSLNGIIFNQVSEKVLSNKWLERVSNDFSLKLYGKIREDQQFITITSQYQIPTIDSLFRKMKCAKDFQSTAEEMIHDFNVSNFREVTEYQHQYLKDRIYSF
ncbi:MAG: hypothetical protein ACW991_01605 [Candidatus Hodarchaeales archaeon]|jgi:hypothetical protein